MTMTGIVRSTALAVIAATMSTACAVPLESSAEDATGEQIESAASAWTATPWEDLGGTLVGAPAAASWAPDRLDVFVRGTDNALWHYWYQYGAWGGDTQGGGLTSAPAVAAWGEGKLDIFVRGTDNALHHRGYDAANGGWANWENLGGDLTSAPAVASSRPGRLDVFVLGGGGTLWLRTYDAELGGWLGWTPLGQPPGGGTWKFDPAATKSSDGGGVDVFLVGPNNALMSNRLSVDSGPAWSPSAWMSWGGYVTATPAAVSWPGHIEVLVLGNGGNGTKPLFKRSIDATTGDSQFQNLGGDYHTGPAAAAMAPGSIHFFTAANDDQSLLHAYTAPTELDLAQRFAPVLRFDWMANTFPMSAQTYYDQVVVPQGAGMSNGDPGSAVSAEAPTYYQLVTCGAQVRIRYWWFYGWQPPCYGTSGSHHGDWENVTVTLTEDRTAVAAVTYEAHGYHYTRLTARDGVELSNATHPVVYPGRNAHGSYYAPVSTVGGYGSCLYWEDAHSQGPGSVALQSGRHLVDMRAWAEPGWMLADASYDFDWGPDGVGRHPTREAPTCSDVAATWSAGHEAQWHTQCRVGEDDTGSECLGPCAPGYTNTGLLCSTCSGDWWNPGSWSCDTYARPRYSYGYTIPTTDQGLVTP